MTAIVLAGGTGTRLGGTRPGDKARVSLGGRSLLDVVLAGIPDGPGVIVVGPAFATDRTVKWVQEDPPGGGPVPAIAAGVSAATTPWVAILAGDSPRAGSAIEHLAAAIDSDANHADVTIDVAVVTDPVSGRPNPLLALWRRSALLESLGSSSAPGSRGRAAFDLYRSMFVVEVPDIGGWNDDIDDLDDLDREVDREVDREASEFSAPSHPDGRMDP